MLELKQEHMCMANMAGFALFVWFNQLILF